MTSGGELHLSHMAGSVARQANPLVLPSRSVGIPAFGSLDNSRQSSRRVLERGEFAVALLRVERPKRKRAVITTIVAVVGLFLWLVLATAWNIGNQHGEGVERVVAQGQLILGALGLAVTVVLAGTTIYYAYATRQMVLEMREARTQTLRPHLSISLKMITPTDAFVRITNAGAGAAVNADLEVVFHPLAADAPDRRRFRLVFLAAGDYIELVTRESTVELARLYQRIAMTGTATTVLGEVVCIDDSIEDLAAWRELSAAAWIRFEEPQLVRITRELEKIRDALRGIERAESNESRRAAVSLGAPEVPPAIPPRPWWKRVASWLRPT
jgi:hypothetical protein